jgi:hypothetical protein
MFVFEHDATTLLAAFGAPGVAVEIDLSRAIDRVPGHLAQAGR